MNWPALFLFVVYRQLSFRLGGAPSVNLHASPYPGNGSISIAKLTHFKFVAVSLE